MGEFFYFAVYISQQLGVMLGVGATTVLLCAHLVAVHHGEKESPHAAYAEAARLALGIGLALMVVSGICAIAIHVQAGQLSIALSPAFLFKWSLILLLALMFFMRDKLSAWGDYYFAVSGGTWYALFLVHSLGPVTSWGVLWAIYIVWSAFFAAVWAGFVAVMKHNTKNFATLPVRPPAPVVKKEVPKPVIPKPVPPPPPVIKPIPPPPVPVAPRMIEEHHKPLSLPIPPPPPPKPPVQKPSMLQDMIDHMLVPALRIMPQKAEDIGKQNRPPVVKSNN